MKSGVTQNPSGGLATMTGNSELLNPRILETQENLCRLNVSAQKGFRCVSPRWFALRSSPPTESGSRRS